MSDLATRLAGLWSAGTPIIYLVTAEEERAVALARAAAEGFDASLATWSSHRGLLPQAPFGTASEPGSYAAIRNSHQAYSNTLLTGLPVCVTAPPGA